MAKKEKSYTTTISDMVEGQPMTREAFKNLTLDVADEWVKINHPEIKAEWINICQKPQEIVKLFPDKLKLVKQFDKDGNPIMKEKKKRDGTVEIVQATEKVPYKKGEKRLLNVFEIYDWLCEKYSMSPEKASSIANKRFSVGNW